MLDCLSPREIEIAREPDTDAEREALEFNRAVPRHGSFPLWHRLADYIVAAAGKGLFHPRIGFGALARSVSRSTTGMWSTYRFVHLARLVLLHRPRVIVEFGTGVSTVLLAELIRFNHSRFGVDGTLYSLEQSPSYFEMFEREFPEELKSGVVMKLAPVRLEWFGEYRGIYYDVDHLPTEIDLAYVDGATRTRGCPQADFSYTTLNADLVRLDSLGHRIRHAVSDHRWANFLFWKAWLAPKHSVRCQRVTRSIEVRRRSDS